MAEKMLPATFGNPNFAAHTLIHALMFSVFLALRKPTRWCLLITPLFLVYLFLARTRGSVLALVVALILVGVAWSVGRRVHRPLRATMTTLLVTLCILIVLGAAGPRDPLPRPVISSPSSPSPVASPAGIT